MFLGKLGLYNLTRSTALFSDALESLVNVAAGSLLLYTLVVASRPADRDHPYGHGKVEFFSAGAEGALVAMAAVLILVESVSELLRGPELHRLDVGLVGLVGLSGVNALLAVHLIRTGRSTDSAALVADGRHVMTDVVTSAGVVVGLAAVWATGWVVLDPIVAILVGLQILRTGWGLLRGAVGGLMDEADESLLAPICSALEARRGPGWIDVHSLRSWRSGAVQHTDLHLVVPRFFDADRLHGINEEVRHAVLAGAGRPGDVMVHFDPCRPRHCRGCDLLECPKREVAFAGRRHVELEGAVRSDESVETGEPLGAGPGR